MSVSVLQSFLCRLILMQLFSQSIRKIIISMESQPKASQDTRGVKILEISVVKIFGRCFRAHII